MTSQRIQQIAWFGFLIWLYYSKYIFTNPTGFNLEYTLTVFLLIVLIAIIPWYVSKKLEALTTGIGRWYVILTAPMVFTTMGLMAFYYVMIAPNFPTVELPSILHRTIMPGLSMTALLLIPYIPFLRGTKPQ